MVVSCEKVNKQIKQIIKMARKVMIFGTKIVPMNEKIWTSLEMYLKALTRRKELKGCTSMSLQPSWKRKEKESAEKIPMIPEQQDLQEKEYQVSTSPNIT